MNTDISTINIRKQQEGEMSDEEKVVRQRSPRVSWPNDDCLVEYLGEGSGRNSPTTQATGDAQQETLELRRALKNRRNSETDSRKQPQHKKSRSKKFWSFNDLQAMVSAADEKTPETSEDTSEEPPVASKESQHAALCVSVIAAARKSSPFQHRRVSKTKFHISDAAPAGPATYGSYYKPESSPTTPDGASWKMPSSGAEPQKVTTPAVS
eukprot:3913648-Rhodomonas_salina.1